MVVCTKMTKIRIFFFLVAVSSVSNLILSFIVSLCFSEPNIIKSSDYSVKLVELRVNRLGYSRILKKNIVICKRGGAAIGIVERSGEWVGSKETERKKVDGYRRERKDGQNENLQRLVIPTQHIQYIIISSIFHLLFKLPIIMLLLFLLFIPSLFSFI